MTMSSGHEGMLRRIIKEAKARSQKDDYKKHEFLRLVVEAAMEREKIDINTGNHIDLKILKNIDDIRRRKPILVEQVESKKPIFSTSCQPPLMEKETHFREVVEVEEDRIVLDLKDDDYDDRKNKGKKKMDDTTMMNIGSSKQPSPSPPLPNEEVCKLMLDEISEIGGTAPVWRTSKYMERSDDDKKGKKNSSDDDKKNKGKKKMDEMTTTNIGSSKQPLPPPPPPLPNEEVCKLILDKISEIGGTGAVWLTSKYMERSDVNSGLGRLFIPRCDALVNFLTKEEMGRVEEGIPCKVVDQNGERWDVQFKFWPSVRKYIFISGWNRIVNGFGLTKDNPGKIELWCFRLPDENSRLCFGLRITL